MYLVIENGLPSYFCNKKVTDLDVYVQDWQNNIDCFLPVGDTFTYDHSAHTAKEVRKKRDLKLSKCDWTQLPDVPWSTRAKYEKYRQELRDITKQSGFPYSVEWPSIR